MEDINELIIKILNDYGFDGIDALEKLNQIYQIVQDRSFKNWSIDNISDFVMLKDLVWYNFEYLDNLDIKLGLTDLSTLGNKFPNFMNLFNDSSMCEKYILSDLLKELNQIIKLWKSKPLYLINVYTELKEPLILHKRGESPNKYCKDLTSHTLHILDKTGNNLVREAKDYAKAEIIGPLNDFEQSQIYYNILIDLTNAVQQAIQYHKNLKLEND